MSALRGEEAVADERALVARSRQGDADAFTEIIRLHQRRVRAFIGSLLVGAHEIDDLAQEVFVEAFRGVAAFRGEGSLLLWLLGIARNRVLMHHRSEGRRRKRQNASIGEALASRLVAGLEAGQLDVRGEDGALAALERCLETLPPAGRATITQRYFELRNAADIGRAQGKREEAVRINLFRLRRLLRACIEKRLKNELQIKGSAP